MASYVSNELNNNIRIPFEATSIDICFPNQLTIDSILIKDIIGDTLASIPRLSASFDIIPFIRKGEVKIHTVKLSEPDIRLSREDSISPLNLQFIIDRLSKKDSTESKTPDIHINQIHIHDGHISYHVLSSPTKESFDPSHIDIKNMQANIALRAITKDSLSLYIRKIAFKEESGLTVKRLRAGINATKENAHISRLNFTTPGSNISSKGISINFPNSTVGKGLSYTGELQSSKLSLKEFAPIAPQLGYMDTHLRFNTKFSGTSNSVNIKTFNITSENKEININIAGAIKNIDKKNPQYELKVKNLSATPGIVNSIYAVATNGAATPAELTRLGKIDITGNIKGTGRQADATAEITSEAGRITAIAKTDKSGAYNATFSAQEINVGVITGNSDWGLCGMETEVNGSIAGNTGYTATFTSTITPAWPEIMFS